MARYNSTPTEKDNNSKRKKAVTIFPVLPPTDADINITITSPDRLDKLAYTFYEDVTLWWVIAAANGLGKGSYIVPANTTLRIPSKNNVADFVTNLNRNR